MNKNSKMFYNGNVKLNKIACSKEQVKKVLKKFLKNVIILLERVKIIVERKNMKDMFLYSTNKYSHLTSANKFAGFVEYDKYMPSVRRDT